jgi:hypothetical protein
VRLLKGRRKLPGEFSWFLELLLELYRLLLPGYCLVVSPLLHLAFLANC